MMFSGPTYLRLLESAIWGIIVSALVGILIFVGMRAETYFLPVIGNVRIIEVIDRGQFVDYRMGLSKFRTCEPLRELYVWYRINKSTGEKERVYFTEPPLKITAAGQDREGVWSVDSSSDITNTEFTNRIIYYHSCHPLWDSKTVVEF